MWRDTKPRVKRDQGALRGHPIAREATSIPIKSYFSSPRSSGIAYGIFPCGICSPRRAQQRQQTIPNFFTYLFLSCLLFQNSSQLCYYDVLSTIINIPSQTSRYASRVVVLRDGSGTTRSEFVRNLHHVMSYVSATRLFSIT
jgi:hypothetical protein